MTRRSGSQRATLRIREAHAHDRDLLAAVGACAMALETEHKQLDPDTVRAASRPASPIRPRRATSSRWTRPTVAGRETIAAPVGTLMLTREWSDWRNGDWWWIQSVYVPPSHRRKGVFAALYRHVEQLARRHARAWSACGCTSSATMPMRSAPTQSLGMVDAGYAIYRGGVRAE